MELAVQTTVTWLVPQSVVVRAFRRHCAHTQCLCVCESQTCSPAPTASVRMFLEPGPLVTTGGLVFFHGAKYIYVFFASLPPQIVAVIHIVASQSYFLRACRRSLQSDIKPYGYT